MNDRFDNLRFLEALLFASAEPLRREDMARHFPEDTDLDGLLEELAGLYGNRGVHLVRVGKRWAFRTAPDLAPLMKIEAQVKRKPSRAAIETMAIVAYHQPVTRAEIEEIRGVGLSRGTLDTLLEAGWIKPRSRRRTPGRPITWGTTEAFLDQFGLESLDSLPGRDELKAAGLLDSRPAIAVGGSAGPLRDEDVEGQEAGEDEGEEVPLPEDFDVHLALEEEAAEEAEEEGGGAASEADAPSEEAPSEEEPRADRAGSTL